MTHTTTVNVQAADLPLQLISSYLIIYRVAQGRTHERHSHEGTELTHSNQVLDPVTVTFPSRTVQVVPRLEANVKVDGLSGRE